MSSDKEKIPTSPHDPLYAKIASDCSGCGISIDLFLLASSYVDVTTLGEKYYGLVFFYLFIVVALIFKNYA
jgi:hypothetical protein